jgi:hypothetical protein
MKDLILSNTEMLENVSGAAEQFEDDDSLSARALREGGSTRTN